MYKPISIDFPDYQSPQNDYHDDPVYVQIQLGPFR